jgi:hypothetical protein
MDKFYPYFFVNEGVFVNCNIHYFKSISFEVGQKLGRSWAKVKKLLPIYRFWAVL